jgi:hypothetical protein
MKMPWDLLMFLTGFGAGVLAALLGLLLARPRRVNGGSGDRILARLGTLGDRRSIGAVRD